MVKKVWDFMGLKSGSSFRFMRRLVKILKLSKKLLKTGMVVHVTTVGCVKVELNQFCQLNLLMRNTSHIQL